MKIHKGSKPTKLRVRKSKMKASLVRFKAFGRTMEVLSSRPFSSRKDAELAVRRYLTENAKDLLQIKGKVVGVSTLRPRQVHYFSGLGSRIDGAYMFTKVTHTMAPGNIYICEFEAYKLVDGGIIEPLKRKPCGNVHIHKHNRKVQFGSKDSITPPQKKDTSSCIQVKRKK